MDSPAWGQCKTLALAARSALERLLPILGTALTGLTIPEGSTHKQIDARKARKSARLSETQIGSLGWLRIILGGLLWPWKPRHANVAKQTHF